MNTTMQYPLGRTRGPVNLDLPIGYQDRQVFFANGEANLLVEQDPAAVRATVTYQVLRGIHEPVNPAWSFVGNTLDESGIPITVYK